MTLRENLRTLLDRSGIGLVAVNELYEQLSTFETHLTTVDTQLLALSNPVAVTATADGLTTGLIASNATFVTVTSGNADHIVTLPTPVAGKVIRVWVGANGCEVRTPATSGNTINDVDSDGTNEAAIPATTLCTFTAVSATAWILEAVTELGAVITAIVPDTA